VDVRCCGILMIYEDVRQVLKEYENVYMMELLIVLSLTRLFQNMLTY
jgi:hypothetical protein